MLVKGILFTSGEATPVNKRMSEENNGVNKEIETPSGSQPDPTNNPQPGEKGTESGNSDPGAGGDKRTVDAERLNALLADSKELKDLKRQVADNESVTQERLQKAANALLGEKGDASKNKLSEIAKKYGVPQEFLQETNSIIAEEIKASLAAELRPLKQSQEEVRWQTELNQLADTFPEVDTLSKEDKADLKKLAYQKEFQNTPIEAVYARWALGRPEGRPKTVERGSDGRSGAGGDKEEYPGMDATEERLTQLRNKNKTLRGKS